MLPSIIWFNIECEIAGAAGSVLGAGAGVDFAVETTGFVAGTGAGFAVETTVFGAWAEAAGSTGAAGTIGAGAGWTWIEDETTGTTGFVAGSFVAFLYINLNQVLQLINFFLE